MIEGKVKFRQDYIKEPLSLDLSEIKELDDWRQKLYSAKLVGTDHGVGYGNLSQRLPPYDAPQNKRRFVITGSQTGGLEKLSDQHYTIVGEYRPEKNLVRARGPIEASSESMSHGAIYDLDDKIRYVFHIHSPLLWVRARELGLPVTSEFVQYGTPEMVNEIGKIYPLAEEKRLFVMGGHENGIISFGKTADEAGIALINFQMKASFHHKITN